MSPIKKIVVLLVALILVAGTIVGAQGKGFSDVGADHWAYTQIKKIVDAGVLSPYSNGAFDPEGKVSRAEFARVMVKALNIETHSSSEQRS